MENEFTTNVSVHVRGLPEVTLAMDDDDDWLVLQLGKTDIVFAGRAHFKAFLEKLNAEAAKL